MSLPDGLEALLPGRTAAAWTEIAPLIPATVYLGGGTAIAVHLRHRPSRDLDFFYHARTVDLDALAERLQARGPFAITQRSAGTLNGVYGETPLQFLQAGLDRPDRRLEPTILVSGLRVAGLGDLLAMKLNAITRRGQLRDYFDLMAIELHGKRTIEEGLGLFLARYQPEHEDSALTPILLALGHLDDVADDPFLPLGRNAIVDYWEQRQPEIVAAIDRYGITTPAEPEPPRHEPPGIDL